MSLSYAEPEAQMVPLLCFRDSAALGICTVFHNMRTTMVLTGFSDLSVTFLSGLSLLLLHQAVSLSTDGSALVDSVLGHKLLRSLIQIKVGHLGRGKVLPVSGSVCPHLPLGRISVLWSGGLIGLLLFTGCPAWGLPVQQKLGVAGGGNF